MEIRYLGKTDVGLKRTNNEDAFVIRPDLGFCAAADGMGGAAAGEVASSIFVDTATEVFAERSNGARAEQVIKTFTLANKRILDHTAVHPDHEGMGCTAEVLAFSGDEITIGHIGDSRTYRLRNGGLKQLTRDHSLVQDQISQGIITPEEARKHPMRNVILRAVGTNDAVELDVLTGKGHPGDIFLLCSDGLSDMIDDEEILRCMKSGQDLSAMADHLIESAKAAGGKDNVTVVLAQIS